MLPYSGRMAEDVVNVVTLVSELTRTRTQYTATVTWPTPFLIFLPSFIPKQWIELYFTSSQISALVAIQVSQTGSFHSLSKPCQIEIGHIAIVLLQLSCSP
jgi:hypothetical protein